MSALSASGSCRADESSKAKAVLGRQLLCAALSTTWRDEHSTALVDSVAHQTRGAANVPVPRVLLPSLETAAGMAAYGGATSPSASSKLSAAQGVAHQSPVSSPAGTSSSSAHIACAPTIQDLGPSCAQQAPDILAVASIQDERERCKVEAQALQLEFSALAAGSGQNRAYLERLAKAAAEAAAKGYGIQRVTHTVQRTRVKKTTTTTDLRTMNTDTNEEHSTTVSEWVEDGPAKMTGLGILCTRTTRRLDGYSDGTMEVRGEETKAKSFFFPDASSMCAQSYPFSNTAVKPSPMPSSSFRPALAAIGA